MRHVWLASTPKSGNTWARFLLYQYYYGEVKESDEVGKRIPDVHGPGHYKKALALAKSEGRSRVLVKTHQLFYPQMHVGRYIYLVRHPADMILSLMKFYDLVAPKNAPKRLSDKQFIRLYIQRGHNPLHLVPEHGTVEQHWRSWLEQTKTPGIVVRYEDLKSDPVRELRRMVESLEDSFDEEKGRKAVDLSSFDRMRALEVKEKAAGKTSAVFVGESMKVRDGLLFMNKGKTGQSLDAYDKGLNAECDAGFRSTLERFGYPPRS